MTSGGDRQMSTQGHKHTHVIPCNMLYINYGEHTAAVTHTNTHVTHRHT